MVERGRGTILFTGCSASLNGVAGFSDLCELHSADSVFLFHLRLRKKGINFFFFSVLKIFLLATGENPREVF